MPLGDVVVVRLVVLVIKIISCKLPFAALRERETKKRRVQEV